MRVLGQYGIHDVEAAIARGRFLRFDQNSVLRGTTGPYWNAGKGGAEGVRFERAKDILTILINFIYFFRAFAFSLAVERHRKE